MNKKNGYNFSFSILKQTHIHIEMSSKRVSQKMGNVINFYLERIFYIFYTGYCFYLNSTTTLDI